MTSVADRRLLKSPHLSLPFTRASVLIATCGGLGYAPWHPYVNGAFVVSLLTPFVLLPVLIFCGIQAPWVIAALALVGTLAGTWALADIDRHGTPSDHDARPVVIDEFVGAALTVALGWPWLHAFTPMVDTPHMLVHLLYLGLLFRLCDITKPWPASLFDVHWHHPFSIIADDLVAAFYAALVAPLPFMLLN